MSNWNKLFSSLLTSSIWTLGTKEDKLLWTTMLAMKDGAGFVECSVPGLAKLAGVTVEECEESLKKFQEPDKYSRSPEWEGRKIVAESGGWRVLNHWKYRDMQEDRREKWARQKAEQRAKKKVGDNGSVGKLTGEVTHQKLVDSGASQSELDRHSDGCLPESNENQ